MPRCLLGSASSEFFLNVLCIVDLKILVPEVFRLFNMNNMNAIMNNMNALDAIL